MRPRSGPVAAAVLVAPLVLAACRTAAPPPAPAPPPTSPAATPTPAPVVLPARDDMRPPLVRVLLTTPAPVALREPGRRYAAGCSGRSATVRGPLAATLTPGRAALQVGAFADAGNAHGVATRLQASGVRAEVRPGDGTVLRVIAIGEQDESSERLAARLSEAGYPDTVPAVVGDRQVIVRDESGATLTCAELRLVPLDADPVLAGDKRVRGALVLRPGRNDVAVINVLNLEEYLRGVVPAEMGPRAFPPIEALKAQAVAARTYAVAHLGDHDPEGYDLCDSQLCQVYGGVAVEHELTDRALSDTAGEIAAFSGRPIDAMYHSTCGGHTEDAAAVFPERAAPYLIGVRCASEGVLVLGGATRRSDWFSGLDRLARVGEQVATSLGVAARAQSLASRLGGQPAGAGAAGLARAFGLPDLAPLAHGAGEGDAEGRIVGMLAVFRMPIPERAGSTPRSRWELGLVVRLAQLAGVIRTASGWVLPGEAGVRLANERGETVQELPAGIVAWERRGESYRSGPLAVPFGSPGTAWCVGESCLVVEVERKSVADAASAWSWWARELARDEIARRFAFSSLEDVAVTRRGVSGRAVTVTLRGGGASREVPGYAFRRTLELPDTLFVIERRRTPQGEVLRFLGRGWGHGVGMCQNGAYGKALAGSGYRQVLASYYTGIEIVQWPGDRESVEEEP